MKHDPFTTGTTDALMDLDDDAQPQDWNEVPEPPANPVKSPKPTRSASANTKKRSPTSASSVTTLEHQAAAAEEIVITSGDAQLAVKLHSVEPGVFLIVGWLTGQGQQDPVSGWAGSLNVTLLRLRTDRTRRHGYGQLSTSEPSVMPLNTAPLDERTHRLLIHQALGRLLDRYFPPPMTGEDWLR